MNKALIAPIIAMAVLVVKEVFAVDISDDLVNKITEGVLALIVLFGFFVNPKKNAKKTGE